MMDQFSNDRHNIVVITQSGAFLYQTECNLLNDIKRFHIVQYSYYTLMYKSGRSFYEYEVLINDKIITRYDDRISILNA